MLLSISSQIPQYGQSVHPVVTFGKILPAKKAISCVSVLTKESELFDHFAKKYNFKKKKPVQWAAKRFFDYAAAFVMSVASAPIVLAAGGLVKLESKGPMFYKQKRIGKMGKEFTIYKLRTMYENASCAPVISGKKDPRITKVGKFLRKFSIDELPQVYNILKGDMSFVGPRAVPIGEVNDLLKLDSNAIRRIVVLPGAHMNYRSQKELATFSKIEVEKEYLDNWNLKKDTEVLLDMAEKIFTGRNC